jgi:hypothetical protein
LTPHFGPREARDEMTARDDSDRQNDAHEPQPVQDRAPWKTPRLVFHGTITVRTLGKSGVDDAPSN